MVLLFFLSCGKSKDQTEDKKRVEKESLPKKEEVKIEELKIIGTGIIKTIADGVDVQRVNLFNSTGSNRSINCFLTKGEVVNILRDEDPYYLVQSTSDKNCKGYCMKGFVIKKK